MTSAIKYLLSGVLICLLLAFSVDAGSKAPGWSHDLSAALTGSQTSLKDWTAGGDNALSWVLLLEGDSILRQEAFRWTTKYRFNFGQSKVGDRGIRKTEDRINMETSITWDRGWAVDPFLSTSLRTQFAPGYRYGTIRKQVSAVFDPAYWTHTAGIGHKAKAWSLRSGLALREIVTRDYVQWSDDKGTPEKETIRIDGGIETVGSVKWKLAKSAKWTSEGKLFVPLTDTDATALRTTHSLAVTLARYLTIRLRFQGNNDPTAFEGWQLKEALTMGVQYDFF